jgi:hypothetical protein
MEISAGMLSTFSAGGYLAFLLRLELLPADTGSRHLASRPVRRKVGLTMKVPTPTPSRHVGRWETIRYALDSNARTIRLCLIWIVVIGSSDLAVAAAGRLPHLLCLV